jgi:6-phosphogluconolactonase
MAWTRILNASLVVAAFSTFVLPTGLFAAEPDELVVYIGTYTRGASKGIYLFRLDLASGELRPGGLAGESVNPSFVAIHPNRKWLYAVGEISNFEGKKAGAVRAFAIDPESEKLTLLNEQPSYGEGPCHVLVDRTGKYVLVANYGSGSAACLPIDDEGRLGEATSVVQHEGSSINPRRQQGPHAHAITLDAAGRFVFVPDLGLDKIMVYRFDAAGGKMEPNDPAFAQMVPGAGPRHIAFHPDGKHAYAINEMHSTMTALAYDPDGGVLTTLQTVSTLPAGFEGASTGAEVAVHPSGKFVYGSNRGDDSIAIFAVQADGTLRTVGHESTQGKTPRNFAVDPTGTYLIAANQATDNVVVFRIDQETGKLTPTGHSVEVPSPVCVEMMRPIR